MLHKHRDGQVTERLYLLPKDLMAERWTGRRLSPEEAEALSDRIAIMKDGRLLICETAEKIKETAQTDNFEQAFIRIVKGAAQ